MEKKKTNIAKKALKILGVTLIIILVLLVGVRLSLKTKYVHNIVKNTAIKAANKQLNAELNINKIEGDLWKDFKILSVSITNPDTLVKIDTLHINYDIFSLLSGTFNINEVDIKQTYIKVSETDSSQFDILELVDSSTDTTDKDTESNFHFDIKKIGIHNLQAHLFSPSLLPDSILSIKNLDFKGGFALLDNPQVKISKLDFNIVEGRLPEPINISTKAHFDGNTFNLEQFVLDTGRSLLESSANIDTDLNQISGNFSAKPFTTEDIIPYLNQDIPHDNINLELSLSGDKNEILTSLSLKSNIIKELLLTAQLQIEPTPSLKSLNIEGNGLQIPNLETEEVLASINYLNLNLEGEINQEYENARLNWNLSANNIYAQDYMIDNLKSSGKLTDGDITGAIEINSHANEWVSIVPVINDVFGSLPTWQIDIEGKHIDGEFWAVNEDYKTDFDFIAHANGKGFELSNQNWYYDITIGQKPFELMEQTIDHIVIDGKVNEKQFTLHSNLKIKESEIKAQIEAIDFLDENIQFDYYLKTESLNLADIKTLEELPSKLDIELTGKGSGNNLDNLKLDGSLASENGYLNTSLIEKVNVNYQLNENILTINHGEFLSEITDLDFSLLFDINDFQNPNNNMDFEMELKNLNTLAPLANLNTLKAIGNVKGKLDLDDEKLLQTKLDLHLANIQVDSLLIADEISGDIRATIAPQINYNLDINIDKPTLSGAVLQDIIFEGDGIIASNKIDGSYRLSIYGSERGNILQKGVYTADTDINSLLLTVQQFDINALDSKLSMQKDFVITVQDNAVKTDTLHLISDKKDTYLMVSVPIADSLKQTAWLKGNNFDFGIIQDVLLDERFVDGVLSGNIDFTKTDTTISANAALALEDINYQGFISDSIGIFLNIENDKLVAKTNIIVNEKEIVNGSVDLPFAFESGESLPDEFFERPVEGHLKINSTELTQLQSLLDIFNIKNTNGIISFDGSLSGNAGNPEFDGKLVISKPVFSGVPLDSIYAGFSYHNESNKVKIESLVTAKSQKVVEANVDIPFVYNFRTFEVITTSEEDPIKVSVLTDKFNLAALNDFLDHNTATNLRGALSGNLDITSNKDTTNIDGEFKLDNARVNITAANIKLEDIRSKLLINENRITLDELRAKSGPGTFNANGFISLNGLSPDTMDINVKANQFRLINTQDYNANIDLDSKISGTVFNPKITGKLAVKNGFVVLQSFGDKYIEDVTLDEEIDNISLYDSLAVEMQLVIERNFYVRNKQYLDMEVEVIGDIDAVKEKGKDLELFGSLDGPKGYVKPLGKLFNLDEAQITFSGPVTDPDLYIKSSHQPNQEPVTLFYIIEGTASQPVFRFDSDPPMEQKDIIAYTIFGRPFYALDSWQRTVSGGSGNTTTASDVILNILLDEVESLAMQELGIDVVQIDNIRSGNETGTSVKAGWYVNNRTFFAVISEFGNSNPKTLFLLEYMLTKNIDLIITQGDNARQGIDVRWKYDY